MKILFTAFIFLLVSCGTEESVEDTSSDPVNETYIPFNADITGDWKVETLLISSTCEQISVEEETIEIMHISTDANGDLYDNGIYLENTTYMEGKYRFDGPVDDGALYIYVNFSDNNTGVGLSLYSMLVVEPIFGWVDISVCSVSRNVMFTRL